MSRPKRNKKRGSQAQQPGSQDNLETKLTRRSFLSWPVKAAAVAVPILGFFAYEYEMDYVKKGDCLFAPRHYSINDPEVTEANRLLIDFPIQIPGARDVKKLLTPGAKYCLVHIRQTHQVKDKEIMKKIGPEVEAVQDDIYTIVSSLHSGFNVDEVYDEGYDYNESQIPSDSNILLKEIDKKNAAAGFKILHVTKDQQISLYQKVLALCDGCNPDSEQSRKEFAAKMRQLGEIIKESYDYSLNELDGTNLPISNISYKSILDKIKTTTENRLKKDKDYQEKCRAEFKYMAAFRLYTNHVITVVGAEKSSLNEKAGQVMDRARQGNATSSELDDAVFKERENYLLEVVESRGKSMAVAIYGAAHAWGGLWSFGSAYSGDERDTRGDNVYKWNKDHPDAKFSLIEIVPARYKS